MPSTISSSFSSPDPSSTVMAPSLPTFAIALAIILPIPLSPFAEMVPTCAMASESLHGFDRRSSFVLEFNLLGDRHSVLRHNRSSEALLEQRVAAFRPQGHL